MARFCALEPQKIEKGRRSLYKLIDWVTGLVLNPWTPENENSKLWPLYIEVKSWGTLILYQIWRAVLTCVVVL